MAAAFLSNYPALHTAAVSKVCVDGLEKVTKRNQPVLVTALSPLQTAVVSGLQ